MHVRVRYRDRLQYEPRNAKSFEHSHQMPCVAEIFSTRH